jgi:hypothetical protein
VCPDVNGAVLNSVWGTRQEGRRSLGRA